MKSMAETNNNWLGFSLSPHMNNNTHIETSAPPPLSPSSHVPTSYVLSSSPASRYGEQSISYGEQSITCSRFQYSAATPPPLSVMPLKSDGSLCIMEALSRSHPHGIVPASAPPKLEDFLTIGGAHHHHHHHHGYGDEKETMPLSLDSIYYAPMADLAGVGDGGLCLRNWVAAEQSIDGGSNGGSGMMMGCGGGGGGGELQSLSLSMSPGSQSSCVTTNPTVHQISASSEIVAVETGKKRGLDKGGQKQTVHRKSIDTFGQRTSQYRGVTRHRWTGRYEAHLWDNSCKKEGQTRKGRQVYLGGYDMEEKAARAYDLAALKYWGPSTHINFPLENYQQELEEMKNMTRQEYVAHLRRKSSGFSRGASMYRGVTRHHQHGRWQARIGRVAGNKDLYLGTFSTQEEAAEAYDIAAIKFRGANAVTNFDITRYDVERIMASNTLQAGDLARRNNKPISTEPTNPEVVTNFPNGSFDSNSNSSNNGTGPHGSEWKNMVVYNSSPTMHDHHLIGMEPVNVGRPMDHDDHNRQLGGGAHFSNNSSLVTSLGSSREGSPERVGHHGSGFGGKPPLIRSKLVGPAASGWFPISMSHLPVFATWGDT